jgi:hypothetical protein
MKTERFVGHHEAREAFMLSVASVTAIMLTAYLILPIDLSVSQASSNAASKSTSVGGSGALVKIRYGR